MIETAEARGEACGIEKGKAEGKVESIQIGEAKGIDKGKAEEKVEIAKNLLQAGVDVKLVAKSTGLTIQEIELIKSQ